jgi:hypothetical protein
MKSLIQQWKAPTPFIARWIRNVFGAISVAAPIAYSTLMATNIQMPEVFTKYIGYIIFFSVLITGLAGTKEKKK